MKNAIIIAIVTVGLAVLISLMLGEGFNPAETMTLYFVALYGWYLAFEKEDSR